MIKYARQTETAAEALKELARSQPVTTADQWRSLTGQKSTGWPTNSARRQAGLRKSTWKTTFTISGSSSPWRSKYTDLQLALDNVLEQPFPVPSTMK